MKVVFSGELDLKQVQVFSGKRYLWNLQFLVFHITNVACHLSVQKGNVLKSYREISPFSVSIII